MVDVLKEGDVEVDLFVSECGMDKLLLGGLRFRRDVSNPPGELMGLLDELLDELLDVRTGRRLPEDVGELLLLLSLWGLVLKSKMVVNPSSRCSNLT
jgi:hypothetical protein|tara:strand:- start:238 stop:528 length:291 start_codon:yes stop_codon:yes gene_type:complete